MPGRAPHDVTAGAPRIGDDGRGQAGLCRPEWILLRPIRPCDTARAYRKQSGAPLRLTRGAREGTP